MLHFVTSYMKQNKNCKQILETAQYGLEISFNVSEFCLFRWISVVVLCCVVLKG